MGAIKGQSVVLQERKPRGRQSSLQSGMPEQTKEEERSKSTLEASYSAQATELAGVQREPE
jgi:hypothetical protein